MRQVTLKTLYDKVGNLERNVALIKKTLIEEPELHENFIRRIRRLDIEKSIPIQDFSKRYGLR